MQIDEIREVICRDQHTQLRTALSFDMRRLLNSHPDAFFSLMEESVGETSENLSEEERKGPSPAKPTLQRRPGAPRMIKQKSCTVEPRKSTTGRGLTLQLTSQERSSSQEYDLDDESLDELNSQLMSSVASDVYEQEFAGDFAHLGRLI